jgi:hypothetical protein
MKEQFEFWNKPEEKKEVEQKIAHLEEDMGNEADLIQHEKNIAELLKDKNIGTFNEDIAEAVDLKHVEQFESTLEELKERIIELNEIINSNPESEDIGLLKASRDSLEQEILDAEEKLQELQKTQFTDPSLN